MNATRKLAALIAVAGAATLAHAQPGSRNAIVYGARLAGETTWEFGTITRETLGTDPFHFEVAVFFFRAQGAGLATAVYKTYLNDLSPANGDSVTVIEDAANGTPPTGVDGRVGVFNNGAQVQGVFTNRNAGIPSSGFRLSSSADATDASAAGGISVKQDGPLGAPPFETADGVLGFRFNVTLAVTGDRNVLVHTPVSRINSYATFNTLDSNTSSEFKSSATSDAILIHAFRVPAPAALSLLGLAGLLSTRRRR